MIEGGGKEGHATTRMSSMELCATRLGLEAPRVYASSGAEILRLVETGAVKYGVLWEPYVTIARRKGIRAERCELETCCLLGASASVEGLFDTVSRLAQESIAEIRSVDIQAYARLVGLPYELVSESVSGYTFLEEPDEALLSRIMYPSREVVLPPDAVHEAIRG